MISKLVKVKRRCCFYSSKSSVSCFSFMQSSNQNNHHLYDIGHLAKGSSFLSVGGTVMHTAVCIKKSFSDNVTVEPSELSLPLTVEYKLKQHALGLIPPTINRRERHGTEKEVLSSRIIDRSIRPLFPKYYINDIQITSTIHSMDTENDPVVLAVNGASLALLKADIGWNGPIGCVRIGLVNGELKLNPSQKDMETSDLDLVYSATYDKIVMIETIANQVNELILAKAIRYAHEHVRSIINEQIEFVKEQNLTSTLNTTSATTATATATVIADTDLNTDAVANSSSSSSSCTDISKYMYSIPSEVLSAAESVGYTLALDFFKLGESTRLKRSQLENEMRNKILKLVSENELCKDKSKLMLNAATDAVVQKAFRDAILRGGYRSDGRGMNVIRNIDSVSGIIQGSLHGSALFKRGDTHVICATTLGGRADGIDIGDGKYQHFFLHYDFPPFCTGTIGKATTVNRRMIGHGNLAERALIPLIPKFDLFPYTIRLVSECTSSSGSSSMATVCGGSLALIDAGVPIKNIAAGLSIGLVTDESDDSKYALLVDIIGTEDHFGDMDFKVAGTNEGVTAIQLDVKLINGVPINTIIDALDKARIGRLEILKKMNPDDGLLHSKQLKLKPSAPCANIVKFDPTRKRFLIGPGGETIRYIEETYSCDIDVEEEGVAYIYGMNRSKVNSARDLVQDLVVLVKEGDVVSATVLALQDFGCFVKITRAQEALLHISDITHDVNLLKKPVSELVAVGQSFSVKVTQVDKNSGMIKVSRKALLTPGEADLITAIGYGDVDASADEDDIDLPNFPTTPPRKWSPEYFRHSVASSSDVESALESESASFTKGRSKMRNERA